MFKILCLILVVTNLSDPHFLDGSLDFNCLAWFAGSRSRPSLTNSNFYHLVHDIPSTRNPNLRFGLARHHIIPYETLYNFFNLVLDLGRSHSRIHFLLGQFLSNLFVDLNINARNAHLEEAIQSTLNTFNAFDHYQDGFDNTVEQELTRFRMPRYQDEIVAFNGLPLVELRNVHLNQEAPKMRIKFALQSLLTWMPFNYFEGPAPNFRVDDPRSGFEENAYEIIGEECSSYLYDAYTSMSTVLSERQANPNSIPLRDIEMVFTNLNVVRGIEPGGYGEFSPDLWEECEPVTKKKGGVLECRWKIRKSTTTTTTPASHHRNDELRRKPNVSSSLKGKTDTYCLNTTFHIEQFYNSTYHTNQMNKPAICSGIWEAFLAAVGILNCLA